MTTSDRDDNFDFCAQAVQAGDRDRFLSAMLANPSDRNPLLALYAFNLELAKIPDIVSEPLLGQIRLQWWRDALDEIASGTPRKHQGVLALADAVRSRNLPIAELNALIDAREQSLDVQAPGTLSQLEDTCRATAGRLTRLASLIAVPDKPELHNLAEDIGTAYGLSGLMRALPFHLRARQVWIPLELSRRHGISQDDLNEARSVPELHQVVSEICHHAIDIIKKSDERLIENEISRSDVRQAFPALAFATIARDTCAQLAAVNGDCFHSTLSRNKVTQPLRLALKRSFGVM